MKRLYSAFQKLLIIAVCCFFSVNLYGQSVPDNVYFIPLPEPQLQTAFKNLTSNPNTTTVISNTILVTISIVATNNNTVIYYDHWEDGYQASFSGTKQSSTQIWGDNDPLNGMPPGYSVDKISAGDRINLINNVSLPRSTSTIVYDGRDKIASTKYLSVTRIGVPTSPGSVLGSSVEVYDTTVYDRAFQLPIGETSDLNAGSNCCLFEYTSIFVMARENATTIEIDANADGTYETTATLNQGESYHFNGSTVGDVLAGAAVRANKPVQVDLVTGDIGAAYESRTFAMYPTALWDNCYYNPVGRTTINADVNVFIYNPGPGSLTINARTTGGITSFTVGPKATYRYNMPDNSGAHFYTTNESDKFFAVGVHDADVTEQSTWDWGFSLLPEVFLTTAAVVGYGPGTSDPVSNTGNGSPVWVLAINATTVYADFDGDPTTGPLTDPNGGKYDVAYQVVADQSLRIYDNTDRDQTGMRVYTLDGTLIAVAWGEDAATAGPGLPYLDLGTTVTPDRKILVSKLATISVDNGQPGIVDPGDEVTYRIVVQNASLRSRNVVSITDTIPAGFTYIANSTRRNRTTVIPDQTSPNSAFPLDETGYNLGDLILAQRDTLSFRVVAQRPLVANATVTNRVTYSDNLNDQVSGQVTININQAYPPTANREAVSTPFNTSVSVNVLTNDVDRANRPAALTNVLAPTIFTQPKNGTATLTNGVLVYRPGSTFAGRDTVIYRLCDNLNTGLCDTALVAITVQSLPPTANRDNVTTPFNINVQINTLANDVDRANRPASLTGASANVSSFSIIAQPANGTIAIGANGLLTYNPNDTYAGTDQLIYRICDNVNTSLCDTALVFITIQSAPPVANRNDVTTGFNTNITIPVLANDTDKAGRPAALTNVTAPVITRNPANGAVVVNADGSLTYDPNDTFAGTDQLIYRICDPVDPSKCDTALVTIRVNSAPPVANPETINLAFNVTTTVSILANDVDKAGRPAALTNVTAPVIVVQPKHGAAVINANGTITYNPDDTFAGLDTLQYRICDTFSGTLCANTYVAFNVGSNAPTAGADVRSTPFNQNVTVTILTNDTDRASQPASLSTVTLPQILYGPVNGSAIINANGTLTYTPNTTFAGVDTIRYRICDNVNTSLCSNNLVTITVQSAPPLANPESLTTGFNVTTIIAVLANDADKAARPAALTNVTAPVVMQNPANGVVIVNANGTITYNPDDTFAGQDSFIYRICDNVNNALCDTALVRILIQSAPPVAGPDSYTTAFNTNLTMTVLGNDVDKAARPAALTNVSAPVIVVQPVNGTAIVNANGSITYNPDDTFAGTDLLTYRICDNITPSLCSTALVTILIQSAPPVANRNDVTTAFNTNINIPVLANDTDKAGRPAALTNVSAPVVTAQPANGTLLVNADGTITYNPDDTFSGQDSFIYRICDLIDPAKCDTALVIIQVGSAPPVANPDSYSTSFNTNLTMTVLGNDVDKAARPAALTNVSAPSIFSQPSNGTVLVNANGTITYNPDDTFAGQDSFIYRICDLIDPSKCDTALVTIRIGSAPPTAIRNDVTTAFNTNITIPVLANDVDKAGRPAALTNVSAPVVTAQPANGTVLVNADGTITYNPDDTFAGQDSFIYQICDLIDPTKCDTAQVTVQILSAPPVASFDSYTTTFNTNLLMTVLANDVDKAARPANLTLVSLPVVVSPPVNGAATVNPDGTITYNPADTFAGQDSFVYRICDLIDPSKCDTARVVVQILSAPPVANPDVFNLAFNQTVTSPVLANDVDKAARPAALTNVSVPVLTAQPANGTAVVNADGTITYNPDDTFAGTDQLIYRICDLIDPAKCDTARVTYNVGSAAPNATNDVAGTPFNTDVAISILANDTDKAGTPANLTLVTAPLIVSGPANGSAIILNGVLVYNPDDTFAGTDILTYRICDVVDQTKCATAQVTITVQSAPPTARNDNATTPFNTSVVVTVLENDADKAGRPAALTNVTAPVITAQPANGVATVNADGTITYNPADTFAGRDTLLYRICDNVTPTLCDTALVSLLVQSAPPTANADEQTTAFNTNVTIPVLTNDVDRANRPATLTLVSAPVITRQPANGVVTINGDGTLLYNPDNTFAGIDTLIYRICDNVNPALCDTARVIIHILSAPPVAVNDVYTVGFNITVTVPVPANDTDKAGRPASATGTSANITLPQLLSAPANGVAAVNPDGSITYNPDNAFAGSDTLFYQICDNYNPSLCDTARVIFNVGSAAPTANPDQVTPPFNTSVVVSILDNDVDRANRPANLTLVTAPQLVTLPKNGTASINADGTLRFVPVSTFAGQDTVRYRICDPFNPALCDTTDVIITVLSAPPVANREDIVTPFNTTLDIAVLANDVDKTGSPTSVTGTANVTIPQIIVQPLNGQVSVRPDGRLTYNPNDTYAGRDSLIYRLCDTFNPTLCDTALVTVTIRSAPPVANPDIRTLSFNQTVSVPVLVNDTDKASRPAALTNVSLPAIVDEPLNGTALVNADGTITYNPDDSYAGRDSLRYRVCDTFNPVLCDTTVLRLTIRSAPPVAIDDQTTTTFNTPVSLTILANDLDRASRPASLTLTPVGSVVVPQIVDPARHGAASILPDGILSYTPANGYAGRDTLLYRLCDAVNPVLCDTAQVIIRIGSAPPVAIRNDTTTAFRTPVSIPVLANDVDKNGNPASLSGGARNVTTPVLIRQATNGTATLVVSASVAVLNYVPGNTFAGRDTVIYQLCDIDNPTLCDTALVTINVLSAPPVAIADGFNVPFNTSVVIPVLLNDTDKASRPASLTNVTLPEITGAPVNGTASILPGGLLNYTPTTGYAGPDTVRYRICDLFNPTLCDTTLVALVVGSSAPNALPDLTDTPFNTPVSVSVLANDTDRNAQPATLSMVTVPQKLTDPRNGTATFDATGILSYTPVTGFAGPDTLTYRICDVVNPTLCATTQVIIRVGSAPPVAVRNDTITPFNVSVTIPILANDADRNGNPVRFSNSVTDMVILPVITRAPARGMATIQADGSLLYNPDDSFAGRDTLIYRLCDIVDPILCDTALVTILVQSAPPVASPNNYNAGYGSPLTVPILGNDVDKGGNPASLTNVSPPEIVAQPASGTVIINADGTATFTPADGFAGNDTLRYRICDLVNPILCDTSFVVFTIASRPPVSIQDNSTTAFNTDVIIPILANDLDRGGRPASLTLTPTSGVTLPQILVPAKRGTGSINPDGTLLYNPNDTFTGSDTLTYRICDGVNTSLCDTALVTIRVNSAPPVANPDAVTTTFNTDVAIVVLSNDTAKTGQPATLTNVVAQAIVQQPAAGVAVVQPDGRILYNPNNTFAGRDTLIYRLCDIDDATLCDTTLVAILVLSAPPVAVPDAFNVAFNSTITASVLANDADKAGQPAGLQTVILPQIIAAPANGTAVINADGTVTYTPFTSFAGIDRLQYRICDVVDPTQCRSTTVTFNVGSVAPNAIQDVASTPFNTTVVINVLNNDTDRTSGPASLSYITAPILVSGPLNGSAQVNADGSITYAPTTGFAGRDTLLYRICDLVNPVLCDTARVVINVGSAPPVANPDQATTPFNTTVAINVLANDLDRNGQPATVGAVTLPVIVSQPANATVIVRPNGTVVYDPLEAFAGPDTLVYRICDGVNNSLCDSALVVVFVGSAPPVANTDVVTVPFNSTIAIDVLANDLDRAGQPASVSTVTGPVIVRPPASATVVVTPNGTVVYDPLDAFAGPDTLVYRICDPVDGSLCDSALVVVVVGSAPPLAVPDNATTASGVPVTIAVLSNDLDRGSRPASLITVGVPDLFVQPANGTVKPNPDGTLTYTPFARFTGTDTFLYRICDRVDPTLCVTTLVTVTVEPAGCPETPVCVPVTIRKIRR